MTNFDKATNDKKIVRLANQLLNALDDGGYSANASTGHIEKHVDIWVEDGIVFVESIINSWDVKGNARRNNHGK